MLWHRRRHETYLLHWGASSAIYAAALLSFESGFGLSPALRSGLGFGLVALADLLVVSGMRRFDGKRPLQAWMPALLVLTVAAVTLPQTIAPDAGVTIGRIAGASTLAFCTLACAVGILIDGRREGGLPRRIVAVALLAYLPGYIISIGTNLFAPLRGTVVALVPMLQDQMLLGILNLGLLATPWERALRQLRESVLRDALTGAWNRTALKQREADLATPVSSLFLIDIDHFKTINDTFGHAAGDAVLIAFVGRIQALAAERGGIFVRLGGDEFVMVAPTDDDYEARVLAEQVRTLPDPSMSDLPPYSISIGVARVHPGEVTLSAAMARADQSLYRAKASGRDQVAA
jgi:diguanylate cyclase (GGDEF)-like protein